MQMIGCQLVETWQFQGRGRGRKIWKECMADDMRQEDVQDHADCRNGILGNFPTCASMEIWTLN